MTSRRIVMAAGWFRRHTFELPVARFESIRVEQSILARLLGFGSVLVVGVGGGRRFFTHMARPLGSVARPNGPSTSLNPAMQRAIA